MTNPALKHQIRAFYDQYHRQRMRVPDEYWLARVWSYFRGRILEIGAGRLLWNSPSPQDYVIVDISTEAVTRAVRAGVRGIIADGEDLPFGDRRFDLVVCHDVLEHIMNPKKFLAEMCRVSSKRVLVASPNYVGDDYVPGLDRYLPLRVMNFLLGPGRGCHRLPNPHLSFDVQWQPDADAITAANSWWVVQQMRQHGFHETTAETWPKGFRLFNHLPLLQHLRPFMFIVGEREM